MGTYHIETLVAQPFTVELHSVPQYTLSTRGHCSAHIFPEMNQIDCCLRLAPIGLLPLPLSFP